MFSPTFCFIAGFPYKRLSLLENKSSLWDIANANSPNCVIISPKKCISKFILRLNYFLVGPVDSLPDFWRHVQSIKTTTKRFKWFKCDSLFIQWKTELTVRCSTVFIQWTAELTIRYEAVPYSSNEQTNLRYGQTTIRYGTSSSNEQSNLRYDTIRSVHINPIRRGQKKLTTNQNLEIRYSYDTVTIQTCIRHFCFPVIRKRLYRPTLGWKVQSP